MVRRKMIKNRSKRILHSSGKNFNFEDANYSNDDRNTIFEIDYLDEGYGNIYRKINPEILYKEDRNSYKNG